MKLAPTPTVTSEEILENNFFVSDFDTIIKIDARGKIIKVYKHILMNSVYFRNIFDVKFKNTSIQEDGSYFVDCDADIFKELLAYMETKCFKSPVMYNPKYMKFITDKFGIDWQPKKREHKVDIMKKNNDKQKMDFKKSLLDFVKKHIENGNLIISLEFHRGDDAEFKIINKNKLICIYSLINSKFVSLIHDSVDLLKDFFEPITPKDHIMTIMTERMSRLRQSAISIIVEKKQVDIDDEQDVDSVSDIEDAMGNSSSEGQEK